MKIIPILIVIAAAVAAAIVIRFLLHRSSAHSETAGPSPAHPHVDSEITAVKPVEAPRTTLPPSETEIPAATAAAQPAAPAPRVTPEGKPTILVAEDNPSNYKLVEVLLRNDYALLHAENGVEAIALFREHRPALILMDISMPEMDGYEALRGIRAIDATIPVIALTAYAFETDRQQMKACGFNSSLAKPLNARELKQTIRRELGLEEPDPNR